MVLLAKHNDLCPTPSNGVPVPVISTERQRAEKSLFFNIAVSGFLHCTHFVRSGRNDKEKSRLAARKIFRAAKRLYLKLYSTHTRHLHRANCLWLRHICRPFANSARKKPLFEQGDELAQSERHGHVFGQSQTNAAHGKGGRYVYFEQLAAFELLFAVFAGNAADSHTLYRKF